jgi:hypothetical protein
MMVGGKQLSESMGRKAGSKVPHKKRKAKNRRKRG